MKATSDICVVACYFNPSRFETKRLNYEYFVRSLSEIGADFRIVECALRHDLFELPDNSRILRVCSKDPIWQKERLLNLAISQLPKEITKVVWLDCDVIFEDESWLARTSLELDHSPVVQPFHAVVRLRRNEVRYVGNGESYVSFGAIQTNQPMSSGSDDFAVHGHTGFAWAAKRAVLERHGLYDACLSGCGDHLIAHGMCGEISRKCIDNILGKHGAYRQHYERWANRLFEDVGGRVGCISGRIIHLWHGDLVHRNYYKKNQEFLGFNFNPDLDIRINQDGVWEWATDNTALHVWAREFFNSRNEDGIPPLRTDCGPGKINC